jgi:broad specificity phosphatase PhoE
MESKGLMGQIYLVRHGQASFGSSNYDQLSELGLEQARLLGDWFAQSGKKFDRVIAGSMQRHRQTAQACLSAMPDAMGTPEWHTEAGFNEFDHHDVLLNYRPEFGDPGAVKDFLDAAPRAAHDFQELFRAAMVRWMGGSHDAHYQESWPDFRRRCVTSLEHLIDSAVRKSETALVFTSGGTIATVCQHVLGLGDRQTADVNEALVNCGITKLLYRPGRLSLSYLNSHAHLERLNQAHTVSYR